MVEQIIKLKQKLRKNTRSLIILELQLRAHLDLELLLKQIFIQMCRLNAEHFWCLGRARWLQSRASQTHLKCREVLSLCFLFAFPLTPAQLIAEVSELGKYPEINKHPSFPSC